MPEINSDSQFRQTFPQEQTVGIHQEKSGLDLPEEKDQELSLEEISPEVREEIEELNTIADSLLDLLRDSKMLNQAPERVNRPSQLRGLTKMCSMLSYSLAEGAVCLPKMPTGVAHGFRMAGQAFGAASNLLCSFSTIQSFINVFSATKEGREIEQKLQSLNAELSKLREIPNPEEEIKAAIDNFAKMIEKLEFRKDRVVKEAYTDLLANTLTSASNAASIGSKVILPASQCLSVVGQTVGMAASVAVIGASSYGLYADKKEREIIETHGFEDSNKALLATTDEQVKEMIMMRKGSFGTRYDENAINTIKNAEMITACTVSLGAGIAVAAGVTGVGLVAGLVGGTTIAVGTASVVIGKKVYDHRHHIAHNINELKVKGQKLLAKAEMNYAEYKKGGVDKEQETLRLAFVNQQLQDTLDECNVRLSDIGEERKGNEESLQESLVKLGMLAKDPATAAAYQTVEQNIYRGIGSKTGDSQVAIEKRLNNIREDIEFVKQRLVDVYKEDPSSLDTQHFIAVLDVLHTQQSLAVQQLNRIELNDEFKSLVDHKLDMINRFAEFTNKIKGEFTNLDVVQESLSQSIETLRNNQKGLQEKLEQLEKYDEFVELSVLQKKTPKEMFEFLMAKLEYFKANPATDNAMKSEMLRAGIDVTKYEEDRMSCLIEYLTSKI